jgi:hypothetical protein
LLHSDDLSYNGKSWSEYQCFIYVQDELKVMEEVKAKQEKEVDRDEKKVEESESGCVSLKSPGKVRMLIPLPAPFPLYTSFLFIFLSALSVLLV